MRLSAYGSAESSHYPTRVASWDTIPQLWLSWEEPPVGKDEPNERHGRYQDQPQLFVDATKPDSVEDCTAQQEYRHEPQGVPTTLFSIDDLDDLIQCFF